MTSTMDDTTTSDSQRADPPPTPTITRTRVCMAPATATAICQPRNGRCLLLVGSASALCVYDTRDGAVLERCAPLGDGERIHGLRLDGDGPTSAADSTVPAAAAVTATATVAPAATTLLLVWGGRHLALLRLQLGACPSAPVPLLQPLWLSARTDTVCDARLLRCGRGAEGPCARRVAAEGCGSSSDDNFDVAVGYAHDRVELLAFSSASAAAHSDSSPSSLQCRTVQPQVQCSERSLLYSLRLHGHCRHRLLAVAGTVFSHVLLWDASAALQGVDGSGVPSQSQPQPVSAVEPANSSRVTRRYAPSQPRPLTRPVLHRLSGHAGVIFDVAVSGDATRIATVSDDRSLRVWQWKPAVAAAADAGATPSSPAAPAEVAGSSALAAPPAWSDLTDPSRGSYQCAVEVFGHRARVWRCLMPDRWPIVISASEDGGSCVWHSSTGALLGRFSGQRGSVWSLALQESTAVLAMSAADATVRMYSLEPLLRRHGLLAAAGSGTSGSDAQAQPTRDARSITLRVHDLHPQSAAAPTIAAAAAATAAVSSSASAAVAVSASSEASPPHKKAKLCPSAEPAPNQGEGNAKPAQAKKLPAKPAAEICRALVLDVEEEARGEESRATVYMLTSFGRVLRQRLNTDAAASAAEAATAAADSAAAAVSPSHLASAELLHQHHPSVSTAPLVSLALNPARSCLAVGDQRGNLLLVPVGPRPLAQPLWHPAAHQSSCAFLYWLPADAALARAAGCPAGDAHVGTLLTGDAVGEAKLWAVRLARVSAQSSVSGAGSAFQLSLLLSFRLPVKGARLSCALLLPHGSPSPQERAELSGSDSDESDDEEDENESQQHGGFLLCGDSRGSVYLYFLCPMSAASASSLCALAVARLQDVHDKASVSSLTLAPSSSAASSSRPESSVTVYSTGRNGSVVEFALALALPRLDAASAAGALASSGMAAAFADPWAAKHNSEQLVAAGGADAELADLASSLHLASCSCLVQRRAHRLANVSGAEKLLFACSGSGGGMGDIHVVGFRATELVVWNLTQDSEVRRWNCGGDKRSWALSPLRAEGAPAEEDGYVFCYTTTHGDEAKQTTPAAQQAPHADAAGGAVVVHWKPAARTCSDSSSAPSSSAASFVPSVGTAIHARLTTAVASIPLPGAEGSALVITASEDNTVKIFSVRAPPMHSAAASAAAAEAQWSTLGSLAPITCLATLVDHPDVVRALALSPELELGASAAGEAPTSHLLFSGGGRDYLHCTRIQPRVSVGSDSVVSQVAVTLQSLGGVGGAAPTHDNGAAPRRTKVRAAAAAIPAEEGAVQQLSATAATVPPVLKDDPDLRIMCATAFPIPRSWGSAPSSSSSIAASAVSGRSSQLHCVATGNSAGVLRLHVLETTASGGRFIAAGSSAVHGATLLSLAHVSVGGGQDDGDVILASGCTSGKVLVWSARAMLAPTLAALTTGVAAPPPASPWLPLFSFAAHQSGVNSLVASVRPPLGGADDGTRRLLLFSGGDDEAVCAMGGSIECGAAVGAVASSLRDCWSTSLPHAHQSAVRALALHWPHAVAASGSMVDPSSSLSALLFSAGYDQLIRVWRVDQEADSGSRSGPAVCLRAVSAAPADVWDAAALTLVPQGRPQSQPPIHRHSCHWSPLLALGGQGLQLVQLQLPVCE